jgi:serine/threonine protein kinase
MRWQSPERLAGGALTYACDIYAFGMTLFEVFTKQVPFGYVDDYALREAIKSKPFLDVRVIT